MRHHEYGFRTEAQVREEDPELWERISRAGNVRFQEGIGLYSTVASLKNDMKEYLRYVN